MLLKHITRSGTINQDMHRREPVAHFIQPGLKKHPIDQAKCGDCVFAEETTRQHSVDQKTYGDSQSSENLSRRLTDLPYYVDAYAHDKKIIEPTEEEALALR